jgi:hypothetical protein
VRIFANPAHNFLRISAPETWPTEVARLIHLHG